MVFVNYGKRVKYRLKKSHSKSTCFYRRASAAGMVIAAIIGGLTILALIATMCSQRRKRSKAWATISL
jgi:hypothetical protein